jgi:hypothetical protein
VFGSINQAVEFKLISVEFIAGVPQVIASRENINVSWRLHRPRLIAAYEALIIRRVLEMDLDSVPSPVMLASIDKLIVREEGDGGFHHDSLGFSMSGDHGRIVAAAVGTMANGGVVEILVWARAETITALELVPFQGARLPARMPLLDTIRPYPRDESGLDD